MSLELFPIQIYALLAISVAILIGVATLSAECAPTFANHSLRIKVLVSAAPIVLFIGLWGHLVVVLGWAMFGLEQDLGQHGIFHLAMVMLLFPAMAALFPLVIERQFMKMQTL